MATVSNEAVRRRKNGRTTTTGATRSDQLIGRAHELAVSGRVLDRLGSRSGGWLQVVGEPGIGKTALVGELCRQADDRGYLVLYGRGAELEIGVPFGVVVDALDDYLGALDPRRLEALGGAQLDELAAVFPSLTLLGGMASSRLEVERYRAHAAVRVLLERLAARRPVVLALDDVHWADAASVELIAHLLRRPPAGPVLLVLALRPRQAPRALITALTAATREGQGTVLELAPLTPADADRLLTEIHDPETRAWLCREAGGNPFYLSQLARAHSRPTSTASGLDGVPPVVSGVIAAELAALSESARVVARAAAVTGEPFDPDLAAAVADADTDALAALDELVGADLARPTDTPRRFAFRHPIVRRAVYESAPAGWRLAAHARAATALAALGAPAKARAHHVERSACPGDEAAIELLVEAAAQVAPRAPANAARWYASALRLLPDRDEVAPRRLELLVAMAKTLESAGQMGESCAVLQEALELIPTQQMTWRAELVALCAHAEHWVGQHDRARARLLGAIADLPDEHLPQRVALQVQLAIGGFFEGDPDAMLGWAERALQTARALGAHPLHALAAAVLAHAHCNPGHVEQAKACRATAVALVEELEDDVLATYPDVLMWLANMERSIGRLDDALAHADRGLALARAAGQGYVVPSLQIVKAVVLGHMGRLLEAAELSEAVYEAGLLLGNRNFQAIALQLRCWSALQRGDLAAALQFGEETAAVAKACGTLVRTASDRWLAAALLEAGEAEPARALLLDRAGGYELGLIERAGRPHAYELLAQAELALGRIDAAEAWVRRAEADYEGLDVDFWWLHLHRARAAVQLARSNPETAAQSALVAAAAADAVGTPVEGGRARILAGRALAQAQRQAEAVAELERAESVLAACGAQRYHAETVRELRRLGRRVGASGRRGEAGSGLRALSGREHQIAELVAKGKTNREIAAELFLSTKTIEHHLSNIFTKLGVNARAAVAGIIAAATEDSAE